MTFVRRIRENNFSMLQETTCARVAWRGYQCQCNDGERLGAEHADIR